MTEIIKKEEVLDIIARASFDGYLGFFVGAGFSKALVENPSNVLGWGDLVEKVFKTFESDSTQFKYENIKKTGKSFPEITNEGLNELSQEKNIEFNTLLEQFKERISIITAWLPDDNKSLLAGEYIKIIEPKWFITTNYDNVIEYVLSDNAYTISSNEVFVAPKGLIPIYHIHGTRNIPNSIVISQSDYTKVLRPNDYRLSKLSNVFMESTTLFWGYGLGDINILSSIDLAKNFYSDSSKIAHNNKTIQFVRSEKPKNICYLRDGVIIYEILDILTELEVISNYIKKFKSDKESEEKAFDDIRNFLLLDKNESEIQKFYEDEEFRKSILDEVSKNSPRLTSYFVIFLRKVFDYCWLKSSRNNAWSEYAIFINIIVDILRALDEENRYIEPSIINLLCNEFNKLKSYVGEDFGMSRAAWNSWKSRKDEISPRLMLELKSIAYNKEFNYFLRFLER